MSRISIRREHALPHALARERVGHVADRLAERFGARCHWDGDVLKIEHDSVNGQIAVDPGTIVVEARLGLGLSLFRGTLESEIARILDRELAT